jgi:SAM-dependent methyltransferase
MAHEAKLAFDYRKSHSSPGKGARYDRLYRPGTALAFYWDRFERPYLAALFARLAADRPGGRYLDFACGTGRILDVGADGFRDTTGIDVSETMLELARRKRPAATILCADVLADPIEVGPFDVITLFRFLVRAGDLREQVLSWLRGVIRDDGVLIVNNHRNALSVRGLLFRLRRRLHPSDIDHEILSDREVKAMLARTGWAVVEEYGFGLVPSVRGRLIVPARLLEAIERRLSGSGAFARFAKNRIYVCRPIGRPT